MKKTCLLLLFLCFQQGLTAQTYEFTKKCSPEERKDFLGLTQQLFKLSNTFSYGVSTSDAKMNFKDMNNQIQYDEGYSEKNQQKLKKDSLNPYLLNNQAMYYEANLKPDLAKSYFKKSLNNLSYIVKTPKDSARYYSFRGLIKYHLGETTAITDIEKALKKNQNDSIAMFSYPLFLMNDKRFDDLKQFSISKLDSNTEYPSYYYVMLFSGSFWKAASEMMSDANKKTEYSQKEYDQIIDNTLFDKYAEKYKNNHEVRNVRNMIDVTSLFLKMACFTPKEDFTGVILNFSAREKIRIEALKSFFTEALKKKEINPFSANKSLAILSYFQEKTDSTVEYAKKAIEGLPDAKKSNNFNDDDMYGILLSMYNAKKKYAEYKTVLEQKIHKEQDKTQLSGDYLNMATLYLYENNIEKADEWCKKLKALDGENFDCLRLLSQLYFLKDSMSLTQFYGESAGRHAQDTIDSSWLSLQFAVYMIINGDSGNTQLAYQNIVEAKKGLEGNCPVCDDLVAKYFRVKP